MNLPRKRYTRTGGVAAFLIGLTVLAFGQGGTCESDHHDDDPLAGRVSIKLQNYSRTEVHLLGPGETANATNELAIFEPTIRDGKDSRFIFVSEGTPAVTIRAVSGGVQVAEVVCEVPGGGLTDAEFLDVNFTNTFGPRLACVLD